MILFVIKIVSKNVTKYWWVKAENAMHIKNTNGREFSRGKFPSHYYIWKINKSLTHGVCITFDKKRSIHIRFQYAKSYISANWSFSDTSVSHLWTKRLRFINAITTMSHLMQFDFRVSIFHWKIFPLPLKASLIFAVQTNLEIIESSITNLFRFMRSGTFDNAVLQKLV